MPAKVRVWILFGPQAFGIGHSSFGIGTLYITWLGGSGGWSASSDSSSVSRSSRSSSKTNVAWKVTDGTWGVDQDRKQFKGEPAQTINVPIVGEHYDAFGLQNTFGLRNTDELDVWWRHQRTSLKSYKGISTDRNCNAVVALGLRAANAELYAMPPVFSTFAGTNKVITFATDITARATWLNGLWERQLHLLSMVPAPPPTQRLPDRSPHPRELPMLDNLLTQYRNAARCPRDQLKALGDMLEAMLNYIEGYRARVVARYLGMEDIVSNAPEIPRFSVRADQVAPLSLASSSSPRRQAFVVDDPYTAIQALAVVVTRLMTRLEDETYGRALRTT